MLKNYLFALFLLVATLLYTACSNPADNTAQRKRFFDLKNYIDVQAALLQDVPQAIKWTHLDDSTEVDSAARIRWQQELSLFAASDINKTAWLDKYTTDSLRTDTGTTIHYKATDPSLKTQQITIQKNTNKAIYKILINNNIQNTLYTAQQNLTYYPDSGFDIHIVQSAIISGAHTYQVKVRH